MDVISVCILLFLGIPSHITYGTYRQLQSELNSSRDWMTSVSSLMTDVAELEDMGKYVLIQLLFMCSINLYMYFRMKTYVFLLSSFLFFQAGT
jgi:hypothetical protein